MSDPPVRHPRRTRRALIALALLGLIAAMVAAPATPASAKIVDRWGFAFNDAPNPVPDYVMPVSRQWGSWKAAFPADWATVTKVGVGTYRVRFPHLAGKGIAHVTAVNVGPVWCQIMLWKASGPDQFVYVRCNTLGGLPADSAFSVLFTSSIAVAPAAGLYGYVWGDSAGGVNDQFNSSGAINTSGHGGPGQYKVWLPGLGSVGPAGNIQVTAVEAQQGARCKVARWASDPSGQIVLVQCHNAVGAPFDTDFTLSYHHKVNIFGEISPPKLFAYIWDFIAPLPIPPSATNVNSQGAVNTVIPAGGGLRLMTFPRVGLDQSHIQVTANGPGPEYCNLLAPWAIFGGDVVVRDVACYAAGGGRVNEPSFVTYTSRF